jgi:magnesium-protoporphyrin IX monomethyl ester (oxidative) cyclase
MRYKFLRVLLVKPKGRKGLGFSADVIPIGLEYIAASIEKEVDKVWVIDMEFEKHPFQHFLTIFQPHLVGITMSATDHNEGLRLAKIAKDSGITTVLGGYHPTTIPDELLSHPQVDIIARGEGELTMKELVQKGSPDGILGISFKKDGKIIHNPDRPLIENLDSLPFPARHLRRHKYRDYMINNGKEVDGITMSRGCWGRCSFCCEPYMSKSRMRFRSPENIMNELFEIVSFHKGKPLQIFATDPHFIGDPKRIDDLCDLLQKHKLDITFSVMTRVDSIVRHPELVKRMCDSGILIYELGFESPNQEDLNNVKKGTTVEMQEKAVKILRDNGAEVSGTFVIGLPDHDEEEIKQFPIYAKKIGLMNCGFGIVTPFPKTDFYEKLEKDGLIFERDWTKYDEMHSVFKLNPLTPERLEELETYCMARFWAINTLLDRAKVLQKRTGKKTSLKDFIYDIIAKAKFARNAGYDMINGGIEDYVKVALDAIIDAEMEENGRKIFMQDVIEMSRFLKILGPQVIQIALKCDNQVVSYVIKTTSKKVEFIKTISGKQNNATIDINIDLDEVINSFNGYSQLNRLNYISLLKQARNVRGILNVLRLCPALTIDLSCSFLEDKLTVIKNGSYQ